MALVCLNDIYFVIYIKERQQINSFLITNILMSTVLLNFCLVHFDFSHSFYLILEYNQYY